MISDGPPFLFLPARSEQSNDFYFVLVFDHREGKSFENRQTLRSKRQWDNNKKHFLLGERLRKSSKAEEEDEDDEEEEEGEKEKAQERTRFLQRTPTRLGNILLNVFFFLMINEQ